MRENKERESNNENIWETRKRERKRNDRENNCKNDKRERCERENREKIVVGVWEKVNLKVMSEKAE